MTLSDLHNDPRRMAEFLDIPWEETQRRKQSSWYGYRHHSEAMETVSPETIVAEVVSAICRANEDAWAKSRHNQFKPRTWTQHVQEALRVEFGITKGTVSERIALAKMNRPDIYETPEQAEAKDAAELEQSRRAFVIAA